MHMYFFEFWKNSKLVTETITGLTGQNVLLRYAKG